MLKHGYERAMTDRSVTDDDIGYVSKKLGRSWIDLGRALHVNEANLENIRMDSSVIGSAEMAHQMLLTWFRAFSVAPLLNTLLDALARIRRKDITADLLKKLHSATPNTQDIADCQQKRYTDDAGNDRKQVCRSFDKAQTSQKLFRGDSVAMNCTFRDGVCSTCFKTISEEGQCLFCAQNNEYEESVLTDQQREVALSNNQQTNLTANILNTEINPLRQWHMSSLNNEPQTGDLIELKFETANQIYKRKFQKSSDVQQVIHFVGTFPANTGAFKLNEPITGCILDSQTAAGSLEALGIDRNAKFYVQWLDNLSSFDITAAINQFSIQKQPDVAVNVCRANILAEMLKIYADCPEIYKHGLKVTYKGEKGVDEDGLTRDLFCSFWIEAKLKYFVGESEWVPFVNPSAGENVYHNLGTILGHGLLLANYVPLYFAKACFSLIVRVEPSEEVVLSSFLNFVSVAERKAISTMRNSPESVNKRITQQLLRTFSRLGGTEIPAKQAEDFKKQLMGFAKSEVLLKPKAVIDKMACGFKNALQQYVDPNSILLHIAAINPTADKVLDLLPDNESLEPEKEAALNYLKEFIEGCSDEVLRSLLRFITGCETITGNILVELNALTGEERRISSNVCSRTIHLPTTFRNYSEFKECFSNTLSSPIVWTFDSA